MDLNKYQEKSIRTMKVGGCLEHKLANMAMGLAGESGELIDYLKKVIYHEHRLNSDKLVHEMGDVLWYLTALATLLGISLADIAEENIRKLEQRYPDGFDPEKSKNRSKEN